METYDCLLTRGDAQLRLRFDIDPASFSPPLDAKDPPRRQVSRVTIGARPSFEAEALLSRGGTRGFWSGGHGVMLTRAPDGTARMTDGDDTAPWRGDCKEMS